MMISIILGTRPEIIKMSPVIRELENQGLDYFILHTGQHYSYNLDKIFFNELELPEAKYNLDAGSGSHAEETGKMLIEIEKVLEEEKPDVVLVEGDTNTVLAGALATSKLHIKVGHVEAGLRSYDRTMPEEINRVLADHVSDYLFAPTEKAKENLLREGIEEDKIFVTGNTIVDAIYQNLEIARRKVNILNKLNLSHEEYFLVTAHRQENVDAKDRLKGILEGLELVYNDFNLPIIYPIHPRTKKRIKEFGLEVPKGVELIEPLGFLEFLQLEANAKLVLTDSGGVQEETCILKVPCVTLRDNTERPETLEVGSNVLVGTNQNKISEGVKIMLSKDKNWNNPFGDGRAGVRIVEVIRERRKEIGAENGLEDSLKPLEAIFKMEKEQVECEFAPYFYTYFRSLFEDPSALSKYSQDCEHIFNICGAQDKNILDIGCGFGIITILLAIFGAKKCIGIDLNEEKISVSKKILSKFDPPISNIEVKLGDATKLDFEDEYFDIVVANEVISHVRDRDSFFCEVNRVLRQDGILYIRDGNSNLNILAHHRVKKVQRMLEYGPIDKTLLRGTDKPIPWILLREKMIKEKYPTIDHKKLKYLARETAGMAGDEIFKVVDEYLARGRIRQKPAFKFRNPETGEYQEFEFNPYQLKKELKNFGFQGKILKPYFSVQDKGILRKVAAKGITLSYPLSIMITPNFTIVAKKVSHCRELKER